MHLKFLFYGKYYTLAKVKSKGSGNRIARIGKLHFNLPNEILESSVKQIAIYLVNCYTVL